MSCDKDQRKRNAHEVLDIDSYHREMPPALKKPKYASKVKMDITSSM